MQSGPADIDKTATITYQALDQQQPTYISSLLVNYRENSNTICMILTKSRSLVEGLRIIQVNLKNA